MKQLMATLAVAAALATAVGGSAWGQSAATAGDDPAKVELARQVIEVTGGQQQSEAQIRSMFSGIEKSINQIIPADEGRVVQAMYADMETEMVKLTPQFVDISVHLYAQNYTEKELRDLLAFQSSDSGRSIASKSATVRAQAFAAVTPLIKVMMPTIMHKAADRACEENHCTANERRIIADMVDKVLKGAST